MKRLFILFFLCALSWSAIQAQELERNFYFSGEAGSHLALDENDQRSTTIPLLGLLVGAYSTEGSQPFFSLAPAGTMRWSKEQWTLKASGAARVHITSEVPTSLQYAYGRLAAQRTLTHRLEVGLDGAAQHIEGLYPIRLYRDQPLQDNITTDAGLMSHDVNFWAAPYMQWAAGNKLSLSFRAGAGYQVEQIHADVSRASYSFHLGFKYKMGKRWRLQGSTYLRRRPTTSRSVRSSGSIWQFIYAQKDHTHFFVTFEGNQRDYFPDLSDPSVRTSLMGNDDFPSPFPNLYTFFRRTGLGVESTPKERFGFRINVDWVVARGVTDQRQPFGLQLSLGTRFQLGNTKKAKHLAYQPTWRVNEREAHFAYTYIGRGELFLVGDFNNWIEPGIPLQKDRDGWYRTTLKLPPGRYAYKVVRLHRGRMEWLPLPDDAETLQDSFGGRNGLLIIP